MADEEVIILVLFFVILLIVGVAVIIFLVYRNRTRDRKGPTGSPINHAGMTGTTGTTGTTGATGLTGTTKPINLTIIATSSPSAAIGIDPIAQLSEKPLALTDLNLIQGTNPIDELVGIKSTNDSGFTCSDFKWNYGSHEGVIDTLQATWKTNQYLSALFTAQNGTMPSESDLVETRPFIEGAEKGKRTQWLFLKIPGIDAPMGAWCLKNFSKVKTVQIDGLNVPEVEDGSFCLWHKETNNSLVEIKSMESDSPKMFTFSHSNPITPDTKNKLGEKVCSSTK